MNRSGAIRRAFSAEVKSPTISSTNSRTSRPSSPARSAMFTECSSVPVRKRVSSAFIRCHRAMTSAPMTSYKVCRPGLLLGYAIAVVR